MSDLVRAIQFKNGPETYKMLKTILNHNPLSESELINLKAYGEQNGQEWQTFLDLFVNYLKQLYSGIEASLLYDQFESVFSMFIPIFDDEWMRFFLKEFCSHLLSLAKKADIAREAKGITKNDMKSFYVLKARSKFDTFQNKVMNDRFANQNAKSGVYILVNWNLRTLFMLKELSLGPKVIQQTEIQIQKREAFHCFSIAQRVTYNFFAGKLHLYNHEFSESDKHLTYAFTHCPRAHSNHKRKILCLLLVCRMVRGSYPSVSLLKKYSLADQFGPLILALTSGNFEKFHQHLNNHQNLFTALNCFSILKYRTELMLLRNLFHHGIRIMNDNKVSCESLFAMCRIAGIPEWTIASVNDVEATLVSMIDEGLVKGYLVHVSKVLVLSKVDPLPGPYSVYTTKYGQPVISAY